MAERPIVIIGAGPAGVRAAETLVAAGLRPTVIDEAAISGGQVYRRQPVGFSRTPRTLYGADAAKAVSLHRCFDVLTQKIDYRPETLVWGLVDDRLFLQHGSTACELRFGRLLLATGATDRILPIPGWTHAGVYTLGAAQVALKAQGVAVGSRVAFLGSGPLLYLVAWQYLRAGVEVAAVLDTASPSDRYRALPLLSARPMVLWRGLRLRASLQRAGVALHDGVCPKAIETGEDDACLLRWEDARGQPRKTVADAVAMGWHLRPETQLAGLAGCRATFDAAMRQWRPETDEMGRSSRPDIYLAGDGGRILGADGAEAAGTLAALAVLKDMGKQASPALERRLKRRKARMARFAEGLAKAFPWPAELAANLPDDTMLCRCEGVTAGAFRATLEDIGSDDLNRTKALGRLAMGRCQGRFCSLAAAEIMQARMSGPIDGVRPFRAQAPIKPVPMNMRLDPREDQ